MQDVSNPHGKFLRQLLSRQETASAFFKAVIPEPNQQSLDITALEISKDQFVDDDLYHQLSDMLFRVYRTDLAPAFIYLLFQHKGNPEPLISYLLLRYMERIWEQTISQGLIGHLPLTIPVVLYNGTTSWNVSDQFGNLFGKVKELSLFLPDFQYILYDLSQLSEKKLPENPILATGMRLLQNINDRHFIDMLPQLLTPLKKNLNHDRTRQFLSHVIEYVCSSTELDEKNIRSVMEEVFEKTGKDIFMSVHEKLFHNGVVHQARDAIIDVLTVRFEDIPSSILDTLYNINEVDILKILHKQAVTSMDMDEFDEVLEMMLF
ncbi:MAG: Rpn family recombination-promoting nuclease/putative transposase [Candidatus Magnetomorum sp.]|nr:Rpn family recombination-promoting nuclease/putative transposase [Candidatus Magnetomorum sp.]